ncbi:MAG: SH3 domain-containing protein [Lachnospiraceae bacterium]|nr:SH3 domain-containing protein [Lachnospiraceae bacterium]
MSNRTKHKLRNLSMYMKKEVFNGRYIVRNILAATVLVTVLTVIYGLGSLIKINDKDEAVVADVEITDESVEDAASINIDTPSTINADSINVLMASVDAGSEADVEAVGAQMIADAGKEFDEKCVSISDDVNIREESNTDSAIVGKMDDGSVADIISSDGEWLKISSGGVTGYVKSEYVKTGSDAYTYAQDFYSVTGLVTEDGVNVRSGASTDSEVLTAAFTGTSYEVDKEETEDLDGWVCIKIDSDNKGYVSADYINVTEGYPVASAYNEISNEDEIKSELKAEDNIPKTETKAVVISENNEKEEIITDKKEEITTEAEINNDSESATEADTEEVVTEEVVTEENTTEESVSEEETEEESETDDDNQVTVAVTARGSISLSEEDINLMAAVMTLECGNESYEGQLAVANVILNRLQSGSWGSTMSGVVYAPSQFSVVNMSSFNTYISPSCLQAAKDACAGTNNIGGFMSFRPVSNVDTSTLESYTIIGNHCFF